MLRLSIASAKGQRSALVDWVAQKDDAQISRRAVAIARLVRAPQTQAKGLT